MAMAVIRLLALLLGLLALLWFAFRSRDICVLSVRRGRVLLMRGGLPQGLLAALAEIVERRGVAKATVRIARDGERGRLSASGLDATALQQARNVLGTYPLPRLLAGHVRRPQNLGQRLGIAWLAWWLRAREQARRRS
jgi:hypothetical protein